MEILITVGMVFIAVFISTTLGCITSLVVLTVLLKKMDRKIWIKTLKNYADDLENDLDEFK